MRRQLAVCLLALAAAASLCTAAQAAAVIYELSDAGVVQAAAEAPVSAASAATAAAAAAAAAAASAGADPDKQQRVAAVAAAAASAAPGVAAVAASLSAEAGRRGIAVLGQAPVTSIFQGAVLQTGSSSDALKLKQQLEQSGLVKRAWLARTRHLVKPVQVTQDLPEKWAAAAAAAAAAATSTVDSSSSSSSSSSTVDGGGATTAEAAANDGGSTDNPAAAGTAAAAAGLLPSRASSGSVKSTGLVRLQQDWSGLSGASVLACIIDTGIDYTLPQFGNCSAINEPPGSCKVAVGRDFVGDGFDGQAGQPVAGGAPIDCYDKVGHGTMVGSVITTANGLARGAKLGSYRVFGCSGHTTDDVVLQAIDRAVQDGCDIINLSLADGSGYAESSLYTTVMERAFGLGVLAVKAAGNKGEDGPFQADVATAAGAISIGSVGDFYSPLDEFLTVSPFSSYGPAPTLGLTPHICAPGYMIPVTSKQGDRYYTSGTSFAAPYVSAVVALWLQNKQRLARAAGVKISAALVNQDRVLRGLVATAGPIPDVWSSGGGFLEPVARCGAGVLQADAFLLNQVRLEPMMIQLPSNLTGPWTTSVTVSWEGSPHPEGTIIFDPVHDKATSVTITDGWYGSEAAVRRRWVAADVTFPGGTVRLDTTNPAAAVTLQVTFSLSEALRAQRLLYSGRIRLQPRAPLPATSDTPATGPRLVPVSVPYQGFSGELKALRLMARPMNTWDAAASAALRRYQNMLCYAPGRQPPGPETTQDSGDVPGVCSGGFAEAANATLLVSLRALQTAPDCTMRVVLAPQLPIKTMTVRILDAVSGRLLGSLEPLDLSNGDSLAATHKQLFSYCLRFNGTFLASSAASSGAVRARGRAAGLRVAQAVVAGGSYRLRADCEGPVATADAALGITPRISLIPIKGAFQVTA